MNENEPPLPTNVGIYTIRRRIGMGGMGEVYEAFDPVCHRKVALKLIRSDRRQHPQLRKRFLKEAFLTAQLTHPAIIPIYAIHDLDDLPYYVMPAIEGKSLKEIIIEAQKAQKGDLPYGEGSIDALIDIFYNACQAIAYAHSQGILHRDLKPDNIMLGHYGQVLIVDWGLIQRMDDPSTDEEIENLEPIALLENATLPGKVIGTLAFMAPEHALGQPSSIATDIYALGVILYQILTLHLPFRRVSLSQFRQNHREEKLYEPALLAPYREIPEELSRIAKTCLAVDPTKRFATVDALIREIENYKRGLSSDWIHVAALKPELREDWEFCENILVPTHLAISRETVVTDWIGVMVSKSSFPGSVGLHAHVRIHASGSGIGFLLNVPAKEERRFPTDGYCLWLSATSSKPSRLFSNATEVLQLPDLYLPKEEWCDLRLEKLGDKIRFFCNGELLFSWNSYYPLAGSQVGLIYQDTQFDLSPLTIEVKSVDLYVSCLAVPNALLAYREYGRALKEYRRIGTTFQSRAEGRQALFLAGITLLEQAKQLKLERHPESAKYFDLALEEFGKMRKTPSAPWEYLGKALVYEALEDTEEEVKCFELALRKYGKHPLITTLHDHLFYRLHTASRNERTAAYRFAYLALFHLPQLVDLKEHLKFFNHLQKNWETPPFLHAQSNIKQMLVPIAFWLNSPLSLIEIGDKWGTQELLIDILLSLIELGYCQRAAKFHRCHSLKGVYCLPLDLNAAYQEIQNLSQVDPIHERILWVYLHQCVAHQLWQQIEKSRQLLLKLPLSSPFRLQLDAFYLWARLALGHSDEAEALLPEIENAPGDPSLQNLGHFLRGIFLCLSKGAAESLKYYARSTDLVTPLLWKSGGGYLTAAHLERQAWLKQAFDWEKKQLALQLQLWHGCSKSNEPEIPT